MDTRSVAEKEERRDERRRTILKEAVERFNNESLDEEERLMLRDRILRLRKALAA